RQHGSPRVSRPGARRLGKVVRRRRSRIHARQSTLVEALDPGILPGPARIEQKAWFLLDAPPPAAAGHILCLSTIRSGLSGIEVGGRAGALLRRIGDLDRD